MSKRKQADGHNDELSSKKVKLAHVNGSEAHENGVEQVVPIVPTNDARAVKRAEKEARRLAKRERRKAKAEREKRTESAVLVVDGEKQIAERKSRKAENYKKTSRWLGWQVSDAVGGQLIDIDPVFSLDEQYLLLAYESTIAVYATSTSLRVRTLAPKSTYGAITAFALSTTNPSQLYVSLNQGLIEKWNWTDGSRIGKWFIKSKISDLSVTTRESDGMEEDLVFTIDYSGAIWMITAHQLRSGHLTKKTETHTLLKSSNPITNLKALNDGEVLVASAGIRLMIGSCTKKVTASLQNLVYTWRELECPEWITSLDAQFSSDRTRPLGSKDNAGVSSRAGAVNIVTGGLQGSIFIYRDFLRQLVQKEKKELPAPIVPHLHWHRNGVGAIKWSADGNYIISGGIETVMVLWQLDTGQKQFLPHLSAPIEAITVSPHGSSYGVRIADNSAMVLSTAELQPTVSVSGIQLATQRQPMIKLPDVSRVSEPTGRIQTFRRQVAVLSATSPGQLLLVVPGASSSRTGISSNQNAAYLQSLDMRSGAQISRQALTRTKVTDRNVGPESNIIDEPNVVMVQTSKDGKWLATVEEWTPPLRDVQFLALDKESTVEEQAMKMEVFLKFWLWSDNTKSWELVSRIEAPHNCNNADGRSHGRVLDLIEDPSSSAFATVGDEGMAKIWMPKIRHRDGIMVKGKEGQPLNSWSCHQAIPLPALDGGVSREGNHITARLAYSPDGSLLVVGYHSPSNSLLYMIDTEDAEIQSVHPDIFLGSLIGLGIIDRYVVVLANQLIVWDIVDDRMTSVISLTSYELADRNRIPATHLAVDQEAQTFAVTIPEIVNAGSTTKVGCQLALFDPASSSPLYVTSLPHTLKALLPSAQQNGYIALDSTAQVRTITRTVKVPTFRNEPDVQPESTSNLSDIYGSRFGKLLDKANNREAGLLLLTTNPTTHEAAPLGEDDNFVVHQHALTEIFDTGHPFTLPPVTTLLEQVAGLFSKKPVI